MGKRGYKLNTHTQSGLLSLARSTNPIESTKGKIGEFLIESRKRKDCKLDRNPKGKTKDAIETKSKRDQ